MSITRGAAVLLFVYTLGACATPQMFSSQVMEGVNQNFDFTAWRMAPNAGVGKKIELGGRIIQVESKEGGLVIVAAQLPIVDHPTYGPKDAGKRTGEFALFYQGTIKPTSLSVGNRLIVVGTIEPAKVVVVDDMKRSLPSLKAQCVHVWVTRGKEIDEFPFNTGGGYEPLEENTYCVPHQ